jgi:hypothetical protein
MCIITIILIILFILVIIELYDYFYHPKKYEREHFESGWDPLWVGQRSLDCYKENKRDCMQYSNCGLCLKDGQMNCVPGDVQGPFFEDQCQHWIHTDYYDRHIFGEKVTSISPPFSQFYPDYETYYPWPGSVQTLK